MTAPDPVDRRTNAWRPDLADIRLRGEVAADRFVEGETFTIGAPLAAFRAAPRLDAPLTTEALRGETVRVFERDAEGWAWGQLQTDLYVGYLPANALAASDPAPTHRVTALRTFLFPGADLKLPTTVAFSFGSRLALGPETVTRGTAYRLLATGEGAVAAAHVEDISAPPMADFVSVAERFIGVPYLWGGRSSLGLDCSSLVQLALAAAGIASPRDSDLQEDQLGHPLADRRALRRGDLVFWRGHVGIMRDSETLLHANAHHMAVASEPFRQVIDRIEPAAGPVTSVRRLD